MDTIWPPCLQTHASTLWVRRIFEGCCLCKPFSNTCIRNKHSLRTAFILRAFPNFRLREAFFHAALETSICRNRYVRARVLFLEYTQEQAWYRPSSLRFKAMSCVLVFRIHSCLASIDGLLVLFSIKCIFRYSNRIKFVNSIPKHHHNQNVGIYIYIYIYWIEIYLIKSRRYDSSLSLSILFILQYQYLTVFEKAFFIFETWLFCRSLFKTLFNIEFHTIFESTVLKCILQFLVSTCVYLLVDDISICWDIRPMTREGPRWPH